MSGSAGASFECRAGSVSCALELRRTPRSGGFDVRTHPVEAGRGMTIQPRGVLRMLRRNGVWLGLLVLAVVMLGAGSASATSGGCVDPFFASAQFGSDDDDGFFDNVDLSSDPGHLKNQCKDFLKGCKKIVKHCTNCLESVISSIENGWLEECKDLEDPEDRKDCKDESKGAADDFLDELDENKAFAYENCQCLYEDCLEGITGSGNCIDL
jgi:hypothetical protein